MNKDGDTAYFKDYYDKEDIKCQAVQLLKQMMFS